MKTRFQQVFMVAAALAFTPAFATTVTWIGGTDSDFGNQANWSGGTLPMSLDEAVFGPSTRTNVSISSYTMFGTLSFKNAFPSYTFSGTGSAKFALMNGITVDANPGSLVTFDATIGFDLNGSQTWTANSDMIVRGAIMGTSGALTKAGTATLTLEGDNTYAGTTTISGGTLVAANSSGSATGNGNVVVNSGATLQIGNGNTAGAVSGNIQVDGLLAFNRTDALPKMSTGLIANYIYSGVISGAGGVMVNSGVVGLTGNNLYTGITTINGGRLIVANGTTGSGTGTGDITVAADGAVLEIGRGTTAGSVSGNVSVATSGAALMFAYDGAYTFAGHISGAGIVQVGYGTSAITLGNTNSYTGDTLLTEGSLSDGLTGAYAPSSHFDVAPESTLNVNFNETIGGLRAVSDPAYGPAIVNLSSGATLTINNSSPKPEMFNGTITGGGALVKSGTGTQQLSGQSTYSGGTTLQQGTLVLGNNSMFDGTILNGPVGTGTLTLADGTTLVSGATNLELHNALTLGNNVTLIAGKGEDHLVLDGNVTLSSASTRLHVAGALAAMTGTISGPANSSLTIDSGSAVIFSGTIDPSVTSLIGDEGGVVFASAAALPATLTVNAVNGGYAGIAATSLATPPAASLLLGRIAAPANFAGTFGFDSESEYTPIHVFSENVDFSAFTNSLFRIGSNTTAILAGTITPPTLGGAPVYAFGGGVGHLGVTSALTDVGGTPAAVLVSSPETSRSQVLILRGANTFTGTATVGSVSANLLVQNSAVILDSATALPAAARFGFIAGTPGYVGATQASGFGSFADFIARLAPSAYNAQSIVGVDSHDYYETKISSGTEAPDPAPMEFGGSVDLSSLGPIYYGTASDVAFTGELRAPSDGILRLAAIDEGHLKFATPFGSNVNSVVIGMPGSGSSRFGDGTVDISATNTYSGGTTLYSGRLQLGNGLSGIPFTPLGTGALTVASGGTSQPELRGIKGSSGYRGGSLNSPLVLNGTLQVNDWPATPVSNPMDSGDSFVFNDVISGAGGLELNAHVTVNKANTYSGGTVLNPGTWASLGSATSLGTGPITAKNNSFLMYWGQGPTTVPSDLNIDGTLQISWSGPDPLTFSGTIKLQSDVRIETQWGPYTGVRLPGSISGNFGLTLGSRWSQPFEYRLSGTNTYTGGTTSESARVIFMNESAVPTTGFLRTTGGSYGGTGYIGAAFTTNFLTSFLNRFDRSNNIGTIGLDSSDVSTPNVFTPPVNLTGFYSDVRLGSATAAILSGTYTPRGTDYLFGGGGGKLTVTSALTGTRAVSVDGAYAGYVGLLLVLQGSNTYTGGTKSNGSIVRFDTANSLPASGTLSTSGGYIGITEAVNLTIDQFISRFSSAANGVIGLDTTTPGTARQINDNIVLTPYSTLSTAFLGTSTNLALNGTITPVGSELRVAAVDTGTLVLNQPITASSVVVGAGSTLSGNATVTLNAASTYTGGTTLDGTRLLLGNASALGTGTLTVTNTGATLGTNVAGLSIANPISSAAELRFDGTNSFSLTGSIISSGIRKTGVGTLTLSAHNPGIANNAYVDAGNLVLAQDDSLGTSWLMVADGATAEFLSSAPTLAGLSSSGSLGSASPALVKLADNAVLTITGGSYYAGTISGNAALALTNPTAAKTSLTLGGANTYSGGTTVGANAALKVANDAALGSTGAVTINGGTLYVQPKVSVGFSSATHPLVFTSGRIVGAGTISTDANLRIGTGQTLTSGVMQGYATDAAAEGIGPAKLSLAFSGSAALVFDSGGKFEWRVLDAQTAVGWSAVQVTGPINITATSASPFQVSLVSVDYSGYGASAIGFNPGIAHSWTLFTASSITGFDPTKFTVDASGFLNMPVNAGFTIGVNDPTTPTSLLLNYNPAAVPEPSTWVLLLGGLAATAAAVRRRRVR